MKKIVLLLVAVFSVSFVASAQMFDFSDNNGRFEVGLTLGSAGTTTPRAGFGAGADIVVAGFYLDFIHKQPQHRYGRYLSDEKWNDNSAIAVNFGYQIPVLSWLRVMPLVGYTQTNEGITDGSKAYLEASDHPSWYHPYKVTDGTRQHYFNFGGGISVQPFRWFSLNFMYTRYAIYGGISFNFLEFAY